MTRGDLETYIDYALPGYRREFAISHWEFAIDTALRRYGATDLDAPSIPVADEEKIRQLVVYFALEVVERVAASRVTFSVGNPPSSKAAGDAYQRIRAVRMEQARVIGSLGFPITTAGMQLIRIPVPYLEPGEESGL